MMARYSGQIGMVVLDIEELIPENQLLCKSVIRFNLILSMTLRPRTILQIVIYLLILSVCLKCC